MTHLMWCKIPLTTPKLQDILGMFTENEPNVVVATEKPITCYRGGNGKKTVNFQEWKVGC